jgi:hypothetical protein
MNAMDTNSITTTNNGRKIVRFVHLLHTDS